MDKYKKYLQNKLRRLKKSLLLIVNFIIILAAKFDKDNCMTRSASLAYSTLLAVVPLAAFVFSLLTAFGVLEEIILEMQDFLIEILVPARQEDFKVFVNHFINNSKTLGTAGLILFAITSINLLNNITTNINDIWVSKPRSNNFEKFAIYTATLLFGIVLISLSLTSKDFIFSFLPQTKSRLWQSFMAILPVISIFLVFLFFIIGIPRNKVFLKFAAIGALFGTAAWEVTRYIFSNVSGFVMRNSVMYGYLAIVPIFLFWLYMLWVIIFGASEMVYCLQYRRNSWKNRINDMLNLSQTFSIGTQMFIIIATAFYKEAAPPTIPQIAKKLDISLYDVNIFAKNFEQAGLIHIMSKKENMLIPAKPLDLITFKDIINTFLGKPEENKNISSRLKSVLKNIRNKIGETSEVISIKDFIKEEIERDKPEFLN